MAARLTRPDPVRWVLLAGSLALLLLVGLARPNAAQPDLLPRGWAPGPLLPLTLSPAVVTAALWTAYVAGALAVLLGLRAGVAALRTWAVPAGLGVAALLTAPFGSADHVSYVAYGRILVTGGDPWVVSPITWAGGTDPVTSRVEAPWTEEPSVYGPFATLLHGLSAWVGGPQLRQEVWVWQVLVVLAWLGTRAALRLALDPEHHGRVDAAWTLNPLVLGVGVLGAHVDVVATALVVAAVAAGVRVAGPAGPPAAGALLALAASTKVTYGVGLFALGAAWWLTRERPDATGDTDGADGRRRALVRIGTAVVAFVVVAGLLQLWAGPHVYDQLARSRQAVSLATPWRLLLEALRPLVGNGAARLVVSVGAALLALAFAAVLLRATRPVTGVDRRATTDPRRWAATALWLTTGLGLAYSLAAPYSLPWYDVLVWGALPAVAAGPLDLVALARLAVLAAAYVPGRVVGMTADVEALTLGFRRAVAPWLVLLVWAAVLAVIGAGAGRRGSRRARTAR
ncbi:hypothetical protein [Phycicoccus flavus]|uniref:DUF2029 domain-containing protein n=1 Tax=Phycicoccus flavus TaxID=2502783 RepID=A0A8T6R8H8_9MICO|nr:hypothetical protein [Phycicoccus flavus]NHA70032.1 hypothetical protein [Phycicoccus flavus]